MSNRYTAPRKLRTARFPKQRRGTCLSCRWSDARQGGMFCKACHGVAEIFSPRISQVLSGEERWKVYGGDVA
ncbi:hypothetical protein [Adonisia turfae]|uniref:Uncharacterized protein n=1 Tax=Adonisia turfae CCMR0081 TaxID=2292702 RepID=A0A6M0RGL1_9CYAN|nr:hypothetical protein [Adonisia turfae]NEZ54973.1 hypothetical protein [Adonisia turfae CCMR0081]